MDENGKEEGKQDQEETGGGASYSGDAGTHTHSDAKDIPAEGRPNPATY